MYPHCSALCFVKGTVNDVCCLEAGGESAVISLKEMSTLVAPIQSHITMTDLSAKFVNICKIFSPPLVNRSLEPLLSLDCTIL